MPDQAALGGGRFRVRAVRTPHGPSIEKTGDPTALEREAAALDALAGIGGVPRVVEHTPGRLVTTRLPGTPRPANRVTDEGWHALGERMYAVHSARACDRGEAPGVGTWSVHFDPTALARARRDATVAARDAALPDDAPDVPMPVCVAPFRRVHGDLVLANIVWDGAAPGLVDWEYSRYGDPAEDLAYLQGVNDLPPAALRGLREGYPDPDAWARVATWVPLVRAEADAWWATHGKAARRAARMESPTPPP